MAYKYYEGNFTVRQTEYLKCVYGIKIEGEPTIKKVLLALQQGNFYDILDTDTISIDSIVKMDLEESEYQGDENE